MQDREGARTANLSQEDDLLVVNLTDDDSGQLHADEHSGTFEKRWIERTVLIEWVR